VVDDVVKMLGCAVVALGVLGAAFVAVVVFTVTNTDDQSVLSREVEGTVLDSSRRNAPRSASRDYDYQVVYTYRVGEDVFQGEAELSENEWEPELPLRLCVDPEEPTAHVVKVEVDPCGSESVNYGKVSTGTPTTAPAS
jgi:hypothetical protein